MKKLVVLCCISLLAVSTSHVFSQSNSPFKLGLKVSPNIGWMSPGTKDYASNGAAIGATVGFVGDFYFAKNYALSTGFNFQFLNGNLKYSDSRVINKTSETGQVNRKYNFLYLEIPLMIKMQTKTFGKISYFGQMGFGTAFRLKASYKEKFYPAQGPEVDQQDNLTDSTSLIRESIIIGIGCEYHVDESTRLFFSLNYSNSLNNVLSGINNASHLNEKSMLNFTELTVGILF
ncbi:MAG: porin family protein [Bacteroidota bacterium]